MDAMRGDATLFTRDDEVEAQWRDHRPDPRGAGATTTVPLSEYPAGSARARGGGRAARAAATAGGRSSAMTLDAGGVWGEQDTTPSAIEAALRQLLKEQYDARRGLRARARAQPRGGGGPRVARRDPQPARAAWAATTPRARSCARWSTGRTTIDATVAITTMDGREGAQGRRARAHPRARGARPRARTTWRSSDTIVDPLVVHRHRHGGVVAARPSRGRRRAAAPVPGGAGGLGRTSPTRPWRCARATRALPGRLRGRPRLAALHALARARGLDLRPAAVARRAGPDQLGHRAPPRPSRPWPALLFCGWLASRLGWEAGALMSAQRQDCAAGPTAAARTWSSSWSRTRRMSVPGLAGIEIGTASGMRIALDRGPGGLAARRRGPQGPRVDLDRAGRLARRGRASWARASARRCCATRPTARALDRAEAMLK